MDTIKLIEDLSEQLRQCSRLVGDAEMRRVLAKAEAFLKAPPAWEEVGRYFCGQMPCGPADCGKAPCRYLSQAIAKRTIPSSEAREEDMEVALNAWAREHVSVGTPGGLIRSIFKAGYDAALSRLAAPKPDERDALGTEGNPYKGTYNPVVFKRHDNDLTFGVCERDDGFEFVAHGAGGKSSHYALHLDAIFERLDQAAAPEPHPAEGPAPAPSEGEVVTATDGTTHTVLPADRDLAQKLHEMWEDYADDVEENALRIAIYREEALRSRLARKDEALSKIERMTTRGDIKEIARAALRGPDGQKEGSGLEGVEKALAELSRWMAGDVVANAFAWHTVMSSVDKILAAVRALRKD